MQLDDLVGVALTTWRAGSIHSDEWSVLEFRPVWGEWSYRFASGRIPRRRAPALKRLRTQARLNLCQRCRPSLAVPWSSPRMPLLRHAV